MHKFHKLLTFFLFAISTVGINGMKQLIKNPKSGSESKKIFYDELKILVQETRNKWKEVDKKKLNYLEKKIISTPW